MDIGHYNEEKPNYTPSQDGSQNSSLDKRIQSDANKTQFDRLKEENNFLMKPIIQMILKY
jgi:hypothetical protein